MTPDNQSPHSIASSAETHAQHSHLVCVARLHAHNRIQRPRTAHHASHSAHLSRTSTRSSSSKERSKGVGLCLRARPLLLLGLRSLSHTSHHAHQWISLGLLLLTSRCMVEGIEGLIWIGSSHLWLDETCEQISCVLSSQACKSVKLSSCSLIHI